MKKKALLVLSGLAVLLLGGGFGGQAWLKGRLQKESLIAQMEEAWNCRAHLDDTSVSLFSMPATVKLIGLKLAPRDEEVARPFAERAALPPGAVALSASEVVLSVELADMLHGTLDIERLHIDGLDVHNVVDAEGNGSIDVLFKSPHAAEKTGDAPAGPAVSGGGGSAAPEESKDAPPPGEKEPKPPEVKKEPKPAHEAMKASDMKVNLAVKTADITNGRFESTDQKGGTKTTVENIEFALTNIDVAPDDLAHHNACQFSVAATLDVEKQDPKTEFANIILTGSGTLKPFDVGSGEWHPDIDLAIALKKGSLLGGAPLAKQMSEKDLKATADLGIDLGDIALGGVLEKEATTQIHAMPTGKIILKQPTALTFSQYEITVQEKSWFNAPQDQESLDAELVVNPELSARILEGMKKAAGAKVGLGALGDALFDTLAKALMDKDQRLVLPYHSKGKLSDPKPDFGSLFRDLLKKGGQSLLDSFLKPDDKPEDKPQDKPAEKPQQK